MRTRSRSTSIQGTALAAPTRAATRSAAGSACRLRWAATNAVAELNGGPRGSSRPAVRAGFRLPRLWAPPRPGLRAQARVRPALVSLSTSDATKVCHAAAPIGRNKAAKSRIATLRSQIRHDRDSRERLLNVQETFPNVQETFLNVQETLPALIATLRRAPSAPHGGGAGAPERA